MSLRCARYLKEILMTTVLLTGASGYIGKHIALQLLEAGYAVRASVRSNAKADEVVAALTAHLSDAAAISRLSFVHLDLTSDEGWTAALEGIDVLLHPSPPPSLSGQTDGQINGQKIRERQSFPP